MVLEFHEEEKAICILRTTNFWLFRNISRNYEKSFPQIIFGAMLTCFWHSETLFCGSAVMARISICQRVIHADRLGSSRRRKPKADYHWVPARTYRCIQSCQSHKLLPLWFGEVIDQGYKRTFLSSWRRHGLSCASGEKFLVRISRPEQPIPPSFRVRWIRTDVWEA